MRQQLSTAPVRRSQRHINCFTPKRSLVPPHAPPHGAGFRRRAAPSLDQLDQDQAVARPCEAAGPRQPTTTTQWRCPCSRTHRPHYGWSAPTRDTLTTSDRPTARRPRVVPLGNHLRGPEDETHCRRPGGCTRNWTAWCETRIPASTNVSVDRVRLPHL
jgi:hypothetical protein